MLLTLDMKLFMFNFDQFVGGSLLLLFMGRCDVCCRFLRFNTLLECIKSIVKSSRLGPDFTAKWGVGKRKDPPLIKRNHAHVVL